MTGQRLTARWRIILGIGSVFITLATLLWVNEPVSACGVRCGGPHPTPKPAPRPIYRPPPKAAPKSAAVVVKPAPTKTPTPQPPAPTATPPRATATAVPKSVQVTLNPPPASASAQVNYIVQSFSLNDSRNAPKDMKDVLLADGFRAVKRPEPGAVVIFQPAYFKNTNGYDVMKDAGMIGVVSAIDVETPTTYRLIIHTAFDAPPVEAVHTANEDIFTNVYDLPMGPYGKGQVAVLYFAR